MAGKNTHTDPQFIRLLKDGDQNAFEDLVTSFSNRIVYTCKKMHLTHDDGLEVCQDVFLKLWEHRSKLEESGNLEAYIYTVAKNEVLKKIRKRAYSIVIEKYWVVNNGRATRQTEQLIDAKDLEQYALDLIDKFPEKQKQILHLRLQEDLTSEEIADQLSLSKRTVENQVYRGLKKLRELMLHDTK